MTKRKLAVNKSLEKEIERIYGIILNDTEVKAKTVYKNNKLNRKLYPKHTEVGENIEVLETYLISYDDYRVYKMFIQHGIIDDTNRDEYIKSRGTKK